MTNEIKIGDRVRSFDFPGRVRDLEGERACYAIGRVEEVVRRNGCDRYMIKVEYVVYRGSKEFASEEFIYPPVNGTPTWLGEVCNGVEAISAER